MQKSGTFHRSHSKYTEECHNMVRPFIYKLVLELRIKYFIKYVRRETENKRIRYEEILYFIIGCMLYTSIDIVLEMQISFSSPGNSLVT